MEVIEATATAHKEEVIKDSTDLELAMGTKAILTCSTHMTSRICNQKDQREEV